MVQTVRLNLHLQGFRQGDVMMMFSPNHLNTPIVCHAVWSLGGIVTGCDPKCSAGEVAHYLEVLAYFINDVALEVFVAVTWAIFAFFLPPLSLGTDHVSECV